MPELPEVETIVRKLNAGLPMENGQPSYPPLPGCVIRAVRADWPRQIYPSVRALEMRLPGHCIESITRRGKYLLFHLTPTGHEQPAASEYIWLLIHLKMSGRLGVLPADWPRSKHDHVILALDNDYELRFNDARKFGRVYLVDDPLQVVGQLGPEPLDPAFTLSAFRARLAGRSGALKPTLLDQTFVAGVGNIYADEALWRAGLHPRRQANTLSTAESAALYRSIRAALNAGLRYSGVALDWVYPQGNYQKHLKVYGRTGLPCRRCGTAIKRLTIGQRSTHICPSCQIES